MIGCSCPVCRSLDYRDKRTRSAVHIQIDDVSLVIDTGPDFRQQMLRERIVRLDGILFTHAHRDHTAGLDDVRAYNFLQGTDMPVYGTRSVLHQIKNEYAYAFSKESYPGIPRIRLNEIDDAEFSVNGITITPLPVMHLNLPVLGFRVAGFSYITDANFIPPETFARMQGTEVLVLNALQQEKHISHFNVSEAIEQVRKVNPGTTYFTHISHKLGEHGDIAKTLPPDIFLAHDGLKVEL